MKPKSKKETKVDPQIERLANQLVCIGCGLKKNVCKETCDWYKPEKEKKITDARDYNSPYHDMKFFVYKKTLGEFDLFIVFLLGLIIGFIIYKLI